jgi:hypothetical protein
VSHYANASNFLGTFVVLGANQQLVYMHLYTPQLAAFEKANLHFNQTQSASKYFAYVARLDFTISLRARKFSRSCKVLEKKLIIVTWAQFIRRSEGIARCLCCTSHWGLWRKLFEAKKYMCALAHQTLVLGEMKFAL